MWLSVLWSARMWRYGWNDRLTLCHSSAREYSESKKTKTMFFRPFFFLVRKCRSAKRKKHEKSKRRKREREKMPEILRAEWMRHIHTHSSGFYSFCGKLNESMEIWLQACSRRRWVKCLCQVYGDCMNGNTFLNSPQTKLPWIPR